MAIKTCRECEGNVSTEAAVCPHCGAPEPARTVPEPPSPVIEEPEREDGKICRGCGRWNPYDHSYCSLCKRSLRDARYAPADESVADILGRHQTETRWLRLAGWIVLGVGAGGLIWALSLDTSVSVGSPLLGVERVNNVGLMNQKQNLVIAFAVGAVIGVLLVVADYLKARE